MLSFGIRSSRLQRRLALWLVSLLALASVHAQPVEIAGTLPEDYLPGLKTILHGAWQQSPQTIEKALELAQQEASTYLLNAERLPRLAAWADFASNETAISGNNASRTRDNGLFYRVELSQSLFRWGELTHKTALGRLNVLLAEKNYAEAYRSLAHTLRQSYMDLIARKLTLRAARFRYRMAEDELKVARGNLERGTVAPGFVSGKELDVNEHQVQLAGQEEEFAAALRAFARLAGLKEFSEESLPNELARPAYSPALAKTILAGVLRDGGKFTFEAELNALRAQQADLNYRIARVRLLPKFDAAGIYSLQNLTTAGPGTVAQTGVAYQTLALRMTWPIFDGLETRGHKLQALASRELHQRRAQLASEASLERAQQLERRLALDARLMEFGDTRLGIAALGEQQQRDEFRLGNAPESGIAAATANRYEWEARSTSARANFLARWSEFVSLAGLDPVVNHLPARHARENR